MKAFVGEVLVGGKSVPCVGLKIDEGDRLGEQLSARSAVDNLLGSLGGPNPTYPGESGYIVRELKSTGQDDDVLSTARDILGERTGGRVIEMPPMPLQKLIDAVGVNAIRGATLDKVVAFFQDLRQVS